MSEDDLAQRLDAVERRLDADAPDRPSGEDPSERIEAFADRLADLEAALEAIEGYVGEVHRVDDDLERRADAALAATDGLEDRLANLEDRTAALSETDDRREAAIQQLDAELESVADRAGGTAADLDAVESRLTALEGTVEEQADTAHEGDRPAEERLAGISADLETLRSSVADLQHRVAGSDTPMAPEPSHDPATDGRDATGTRQPPDPTTLETATSTAKRTAPTPTDEAPGESRNREDCAWDAPREWAAPEDRPAWGTQEDVTQAADAGMNGSDGPDSGVQRSGHPPSDRHSGDGPAERPPRDRAPGSAGADAAPSSRTPSGADRSGSPAAVSDWGTGTQSRADGGPTPSSNGSTRPRTAKGTDGETLLDRLRDLL